MSAGTSASLCWSLFVLVLVSAEENILSAESGQNVTLTCRAPNYNNIVTKWIRADLKPEYVLYYRDGHVVPDDQHPSFKDRVDLQDRQMKDGDVSVILKNVTVNDTGTYECHVAQRTKQERADLKPIIIITLTVVAPPPPPGPGGGAVGLIVALIVSAMLLLVAAAGFWICRKSKGQKQDSSPPAAELQPV